MTFEELRKAIDLFGLSEQVTLNEIQTKHRDLVKQYHPDAGGDELDKITQVNAAYKILRHYVETYQFDLSEKEFYRQNPEERVRQQFGDDPLWGKGWKTK